MQDHLNRDQIARYCNRQSAPEELGLLDEHIAECADCRERLFSAARSREALQRGQDLKVRSNTRAIAFLRRVAMYIVKQPTTASLPETGRQFGGKHHTTVPHSINKIEEPPRSDKELNRTIARLMDALQPFVELGSSGQKLTGTSRQAKEEHLSYEQLEAFVDEKSSPGEMHLVRLHVEACRRCADDLDDLRALESELSHTAALGAKKKEGWWAARLAPMFTARPIFVAALSATVILLVVMGINTHRSFHSPNTLETANSYSSNSNSSALQPLEGSINGSATVLALTAEEQKQVVQAFAQWENVIPASLSEVQGKHQTLLGKPILTPIFEVVEPVGEVVWEVRPVFRWKPMSRAVSYSVAIYDARLNPVQKSGKLQDVEWVPTRELIRGRVYQWQVTARLQDGSSLNSPAPPQPEARFRVLDREKEEELSRFASAHPEAHLALGILDGQAGLLSRAEQQFRQISQKDADYQPAQGLLKRIQEIRSSAN